MTAITQNLPWFVKDLGVSIVGEKCYRSIVENLNFSDADCLKYCLSKGLGIGIVVGGSIMKVPQLLLIVSARSARGLSLPAYVLETLSYAITLAYSYRNAFPFSTYGENFFLTLQNIVITLLIVHYNPPPSLASTPAAARATQGALGMAAAAAALVVVPPSALAACQLATLPLSLFSKLPQIRQNHRAQSTGQLSAFAVVAQVVGCLARLFTTAAEVGDPILSAGFALALALNVVLGVQMWQYWGKEEREEKIEMGQYGVGARAEEKVGVQWAQVPQRVEVVVPPASPSGRASPRPSPRRWSRKVD
ncbi:mannose-P-dolichol utilization defect 1 protein [Epithele typhae]|uniref:mannose-P-dolichol utilization defect 1 protein n=1 Tax=Epithele typhae TaxID=378194 RepID=UPI0020078582|nr:mannose-P-dolichol utilization defect 1 protein [Epithele typhae]KAH9925370.1 mannose-P-dolichol utilization defect 1 protein [Epithele typhae]